MNFDTALWRHYLYSGKRDVADAMRRAHNRAILTLVVHPNTRLRNWDITFEQKGIDTHAVRIAPSEERVGC